MVWGPPALRGRSLGRFQYHRCPLLLLTFHQLKSEADFVGYCAFVEFLEFKRFLAQYSAELNVKNEFQL